MNYLAVTMENLIRVLPPVILGRLRGPEESGFYHLAANLTFTALYFEESARKVVYPKLSQAYELGDKESIRNSLRRWTVSGGVPICGLLLIVILLIPLLVPLVFGSSYTPVVPAAQIMMLAIAFSSLFFWLNSLFYAANKVDAWIRGYFIYALAVALLGWFVSWKWGLLGISALVAGGRILFILLMLKTISLKL
jgi:O-antigen/teichoic acid export membrane protein